MRDKYIVLTNWGLPIVRGWCSSDYDGLFEEAFDLETDRFDGLPYLPNYFLFSVETGASTDG